MPKTTNSSSKRKRDNNTTETATEKEADQPMAPAQDTTKDKKKEGNDLEGRDFYEVLGIKRDATHKEITAAYRKLATKVHPDKNRDDPFANDKFHTLGKIHVTLSDPEKRKVYDETGETSDDTYTGDGEVNWAAYFNIIFKKVTKNDVQGFSKTYRGSDEERKAVLDAYVKYKGNLHKVLEVVLVSRREDLGRFATYCQQAIDAGDVQPYAKFKNFQSLVGKDLEIKNDDEDDDVPQALAQSFAQRKSAFDDLTSRLEAKYGGDKGDEEEEEEEEEEGGVKKKKKTAPATRKTRKGVVAKKGKRAATQKKKTKKVKEEEDDEAVSD